MTSSNKKSRPPTKKKSAASKKNKAAGPSPPSKKNARSSGSRAGGNKSKNKNRTNDGSNGGTTISEGLSQKTLMLIWVVVGAELGLDLVTTIISFIAFMNDFECCGEEIDLGGLPMGITIPFFFIILVEMVMLASNIRENLRGGDNTNSTNGNNTSRAAAARSEEGKFAFLGKTASQRWVNGLLILNPFFGFMVAWLLLYQSRKQESLGVLGIEAASLFLHYVSVWLEGQKQTWVSLTIYLLPIIPFAATVIVIIVSLNIGGVCYLVKESMFWYQGCDLCDDGFPPPQNGVCLDGSEGSVGTYCSNDTKFCFFEYSE